MFWLAKADPLADRRLYVLFIAIIVSGNFGCNYLLIVGSDSVKSKDGQLFFLHIFASMAEQGCDVPLPIKFKLHCKWLH